MSQVEQSARCDVHREPGESPRDCLARASHIEAENIGDFAPAVPALSLSETTPAGTSEPSDEPVTAGPVSGDRQQRRKNHGPGGRWAPGNDERVTHGDRSVVRRQARSAARQARLAAIVTARQIVDPVQLLIAELLVDAWQRARDAFDYGEQQADPGPIASRGSRRSSEMVSQQRTDQASRLAQQLGLEAKGGPGRSLAELLQEEPR